MTNLHHVADSPFLLLLWLFPPNFKDLVWSDEQGAFTYPDLVPDQILSDRGPCTWAGPPLVRTEVRTKFLVPKGTVYITKFGADRGPIRIWSGPNWFCKRGLSYKMLTSWWLQKKKILDNQWNVWWTKAILMSVHHVWYVRIYEISKKWRRNKHKNSEQQSIQT